METLNILKMFFLAIVSDPQKLPVKEAPPPPPHCSLILAEVDSLWDDFTKFGQLPLMKMLTHYDMIELANNSMVRHLRTECMTRTEGCHNTFKQTQLALFP